MSNGKMHALKPAMPRMALPDIPIPRLASWMLMGILGILAALYVYFQFFYVPAVPPGSWPPELCIR